MTPNHDLSRQCAGMLLHYCFMFVASFAISSVYFGAAVICIPTVNGRYTRDIDEFRLTVPFRVGVDGAFSTYRIPNFYEQNVQPGISRRRKRSLDDPEMVHYVVKLRDKAHHIQLWPNHGLVSPNAVFEKRDPTVSVQDRLMRPLRTEEMCHYTGNLRGYPESRAALSTCDGLAGYVTIGDRRYFIEPVHEHVPNAKGQHLHVLYERYPHEENHRMAGSCGTSGNWEDAWRKRFIEKYLEEGELKFSKRGSHSVHRYLETLVVCDKKFLEHHKHTDYETYILTIMNMVADFYHDFSSGNQMDVVVVRIMYLDKEEEEVDLVINPNAEDTLASFCKWQQKVNPKDLANPNHHDIAVLLTRYDICSDNLSNCGLMGLAYVATACTSNENCAINEDGGLVLGIVVAHEMGHVMGCSHDKEGESDCAAQDKDESFYVMAPYVHLYTTRWSPCSKGFLTALFENDLGECLNDEPEISLYKNKDMLPGVVYDAEEQCKILFPNSTVCRVEDGTECEMLLCQTSPTSCMSNGEPPADGTKCGEKMWCYRKKCIEIGERPEAINGGWGEWSSWTDCSRSCGGGVSMATRECNHPIPQHRGRYCVGERKKVKVCNLKQCPEGSSSFRDVQCSDHNSKPFQGKLYSWKPYLKADEPCVLYCLNTENVFAKLEPRAKDGTPCKAGTRNICISGVCRKIGCDGEIDSNAVEDLCGVCNGDGTECSIVEEVFRQSGGRDYKKVTVIPAGSRNVLIEELESSMNTIAIGDTKKKFFLNGEYTEQRDGDVKFGEISGIYSHPEPGKENLIIHGPLTQDLVFFVVFYRPENVGYRYRYAKPSAQNSYSPRYHWEQVDWEDCSVKCGGGFQAAKFTCVEAKAGKVSSSFCENLEKPEEMTKKCNEEPCKTKWKVGKWGKCHACKYKSGVRMREVECVRESPHPGTEDILAEDSECLDVRPGTRELCNSHKKCKSRRNTDGLPDELMEEVWHQLLSNLKQRRDLGVSDDLADDKGRRFDKKSCDDVEKKNGDGKKALPKLNVGGTVKDAVPEEEIKLIEVPLKQSHLSLDLSDAAFETMGDKVADRLDTGKAKIATGEAAAGILKDLSHSEDHENEESTRKVARDDRGKQEEDEWGC